MTTINRKWKPGQAAKFRRTMKAKHAAKVLAIKEAAKETKAAKTTNVSGKQNIMDAVVYLRHAQTWINGAIASGALKKQDEAHLLLQIALRRLEGV